MGNDFLTVQNQHVPECGRLPGWACERPEGAYFGYYENEHGEQWVLVATAEKALLAGGDCGWETTYELRNPPWAEIRDRRFPSWPTLNMIPREQAWLEACLSACAQRFVRPLDPPPAPPPRGQGISS
jgi:hypothetical protein